MMNTQRRWYIFRVVRQTGATEYRESTGSWKNDPQLAMTWANYEFASKKARELKKLERRINSDYFVGEAEVRFTSTKPVQV
jgi:hypothetical protein